MGPRGLRQAAQLSLRKAHYAADKITDLPRFELAFTQPFLKEFVVRDRQGCVDELIEWATEQGFFAGIALSQWFPKLQDCFLVTVTEKRTKSEIDALAECLANANIRVEQVHA